MWALVDSGSSVHVVNVEAVMPGAKIKKPNARAPGFKTACGGTVPDLGSADVPFVTQEGHKHSISWSHANVAMPILSTRLLAVENWELRYQANSGQVVNIHNGDESHFISSSGVYCMKMFIEKKYTSPDNDKPVIGNPDQLFGRPGP